MTTTHANESSSGFLSHPLIALILAALLALMWFMGYGPGGSKCNPAPAVAVAPPVVAPAPAPVAAPVTTPAAPAPAVVAQVKPEPAPAPPPAPAKVDEPVPAAKVYFDLDKTYLPKNTNDAVANVVAYVKSHPGSKALVSGFHDPKGAKDHNIYLANTRAANVALRLSKLGLGKDAIAVAQAAELTGTGPDNEARRVEVSVSTK
jgi:outer membrane protein OmpA-like peptidoglycan-associated protein